MLRNGCRGEPGEGSQYDHVTKGSHYDQWNLLPQGLCLKDVRRHVCVAVGVGSTAAIQFTAGVKQSQGGGEVAGRPLLGKRDRGRGHCGCCSVREGVRNVYGGFRGEAVVANGLRQAGGP